MNKLLSLKGAGKVPTLSRHRASSWTRPLSNIRRYLPTTNNRSIQTSNIHASQPSRVSSLCSFPVNKPTTQLTRSYSTRSPFQANTLKKNQEGLHSKTLTEPKINRMLHFNRFPFHSNRFHNSSIQNKKSFCTSSAASPNQSRLEILKQKLNETQPTISEYISSEISSDIEFRNENIEEVSSDAKQSFLQQLYNPHEVGFGRKVFMETYGCQMNVNDSEIVLAIMKNVGYDVAKSVEDADVVLINTCAIRDKAEHRIWERLNTLKYLRTSRKRSKEQRLNFKVGILGCMAERLKTKLLESDKLVDLVVGPDAYRDLPFLLSSIDQVGEGAMNVLLSQEETYADINPVRLDENGVSAFVSIMRGCNNMCSYCIVPWTRGRERSRNYWSIEDEVRRLSDEGYKEVVLLGQNVNSYNYVDDTVQTNQKATPRDGFQTVYKAPAAGMRFAELMDRVSRIDPNMRVRFTSPHPKDFPDELLFLMKERPNICNQIHIPAQSGSTAVLERMRRGYSRELYSSLIRRIKEVLPDISLSSDFISGFCGETEEDHQQTISLLEEVKFHTAFMFAYSLREKTYAHRKFEDDVPHETKQRRLKEVIETFSSIAAPLNQKKYHDTVQLLLVDSASQKDEGALFGRTDGSKKIKIPIRMVKSGLFSASDDLVEPKIGDYVACRIDASNPHAFVAEPLACSSIPEFERWKIEMQ